MFAKLFEIILDNRRIFVNEAFGKNDAYNGGFLKGSRTQDNIFILSSCRNKLLNMGKGLFVAFVDFKKAFSYVNHNILFYKIFKTGFKGRVIKVLRNMYTKIKAVVKVNNILYKWIEDLCGTNQGGPVSPDIFRFMLNDLKEFLESEYGVVIDENEILLHLLWADDLVLLADTPGGLQKQLDGLFKFVSSYQMIVNEMKTKIVIYGHTNENTQYRFMFNGKPIDIVESYKYLGCIFNACKTVKGNIFKEMVSYSADKAIKASFAVVKKYSSVGCLSPKIGFHLFDTCISPILNYSSEIWCRGIESQIIERVQLRFIKFILGVKNSTCNLAIYGETGRFPIILYQKLKVVDYWLRLQSLNRNCILKNIYKMVQSLHNSGFKTWLEIVNSILKEANLSLYLEYDHLDKKNL